MNTDKHTRRTLCECEGSHWSNESTNQRILKITCRLLEVSGQMWN
jgi:hypothetical protein